MPKLTGVPTRVYKVPEDLYETIREICSTYKDQPMTRAEIRLRLETLSTSPTFKNPEDPNREILDALGDIEGKLEAKLDEVIGEIRLATARGTRPVKSRTSLKGGSA